MLLSDKKEGEEYTKWPCPFCGKISRAPLTAGVRSRCQHCGKDWLISGIEVQRKESRKLLEELEKRRKREVNADKERE
jgi:ribosomal protein L37AE/L43A